MGWQSPYIPNLNSEAKRHRRWKGRRMDQGIWISGQVKVLKLFWENWDCRHLFFWKYHLGKLSFQNLVVLCNKWDCDKMDIKRCGELEYCEFQMLEIWGFAVLSFENYQVLSGCALFSHVPWEERWWWRGRPLVLCHSTPDLEFCRL